MHRGRDFNLLTHSPDAVTAGPEPGWIRAPRWAEGLKHHGNCLVPSKVHIRRKQDRKQGGTDFNQAVLNRMWVSQTPPSPLCHTSAPIKSIFNFLISFFFFSPSFHQSIPFCSTNCQILLFAHYSRCDTQNQPYRCLWTGVAFLLTFELCHFVLQL